MAAPFGPKGAMAGTIQGAYLVSFVQMTNEPRVVANIDLDKSAATSSTVPVSVAKLGMKRIIKHLKTA